MNWRLAPREIAHVVTDAAAAVLFVGADLADRVEEIEEELPGTRIVALDGHARWETYESWIGSQPADDPGVAVTSDDTALQLYTSGTTGTPKGAMFSNRNFFAMVGAAAPVWGFHPGMVSIGVSPLFHIAGTGWNLMVMGFGGTVVLHREVDGEAILRDIGRYRVTHAILVPAILQLILARRNEGTADSVVTRDRRLRGIPDQRPGAARTVRRVRLQVHAGIRAHRDERSGDHAAAPRITTRHVPNCCGRAASRWTGSNCASSIPRRASMREVGGVGEVWIRSDQVMTGYWRNPAATAEAIDADGWFRSGDAGYMRDGRLYLHDRVKDMIVSGAENIYPAEVENVLMSHPGVAEVAVIGVPHERWGETVKAIVVRAPGARGRRRRASSPTPAPTSPTTSARRRSSSSSSCLATPPARS